MKKILVIIIILSTCFLLVGCTKKEDKTSSSSTTESGTMTSSGVLLTDNDIDIKSIGIELVGETFNFQVTFSNSTNEDKDFDLSKFDVKHNDKSMKINGHTKTIPANKTYAQWTFTMDDTGDLKVGDTVQVYFDGKQVTSVKVTEF